MALSDNICYIAIHGENHFLYFHFNIVIKYHVTRSVILHCLDRQTNRLKFSAESISVVEKQNEVLEVIKESVQCHTVNFGISNEEGIPSCK